MKQLPEDFNKLMQQILGNDEFLQFTKAMEEPSPVSIRWREKPGRADSHGVAWCPVGEYLDERPSFTMDPLFHAGAYYVQEASSMFIWHLCDWIKNHDGWQEGMIALDLCAAPGGKSTLLLSALPEGSTLIANEIMPKRAQILRENISKWTRQRVGDHTINKPHCIVTNNRSQDFRRLGSGVFDFILCDVPCSGEGMFRKDDEAIDDWSLGNVAMCQQRQRDIITTIWDSLKQGGYMIYSTCTYNSKEDEDNVRWISDELGADIINVPVDDGWNTTPSPFFHFYPHRVKGEGFFCALLRKTSACDHHQYNERLINKYLKTLPLENTFEPPYIDVDAHTALQYLHGEAILLANDVPRGLVTITYQGHPLGKAKNIGSRANNLYPKEWRIRKNIDN